MSFPYSGFIAAALFLTACSSDAGFFESCQDGNQCGEGTTCTIVAFEPGADGSMCTAECDTREDCPLGGACFELVGDPNGRRVCYESCIDDRDCAPRFVCADAELDGRVVDGICLPEGSRARI